MDAPEIEIGKMKSKQVVLGIVSFAVILLAWEAVVRWGWVSSFFASSGEVKPSRIRWCCREPC